MINFTISVLNIFPEYLNKNILHVLLFKHIKYDFKYLFFILFFFVINLSSLFLPYYLCDKYVNILMASFFFVKFESFLVNYK